MEPGTRFVDAFDNHDELQEVAETVWADFCLRYGVPDLEAGNRVEVTKRGNSWCAVLLDITNRRLAVYEVHLLPDGGIRLELVVARPKGTGQVRLIGAHEEESE